MMVAFITLLRVAAIILSVGLAVLADSYCCGLCFSAGLPSELPLHGKNGGKNDESS
jgi:hypothetical protein